MEAQVETKRACTWNIVYSKNNIIKVLKAEVRALKDENKQLKQMLVQKTQGEKL